ncbi:LuxR C-terminal-related transcriptional regulator [Erwinia rhapontici]|uniref:HTH luxR-type domain-containing protein n=1 Tax=Erwinia rhapontici TaxID=55212 RepID=A0ABM7MUK2_ERWRD|nr:LuxR C-terminal-related transcriptional regulator [Erwinia rhapontici]MCS3608630.1 DNA-binding CsgD family transcriptional regulator [Erwinia rhapontici]BCQ32838.1 hypothetical protein ERHA53_01810 [Erwinia rhapontici]BCQ37598.1 hypothetical protein ERHA54_02010 [Erwinia rhapontici]
MKILIESENFFYKKGLESLLQQSALESAVSDFGFITDDDSTEKSEITNITLRDSSISINLFKNKKKLDEPHISKEKSTLHIPFACKNKKITDIKRIIEKIIFIASMDSNDFINDDFYRITGLKKHEQLSLTETKIMLLLGRGNNIRNISRQINRSERTINVHFRNASRKMKFNKKTDFYNYAKFIVTCRRNERKTLCI